MKKYLLLILCTLFISVSLSAQSKSNQHLKFMGIPINGSITNFQNKLIAKGFKYDQAGSKALESPTRIYKGQFAGETAQLFVYYDRDQKFVYRVKVIIDRSESEQVISLMKKYKYQMEEKYGATASVSTHNGEICYNIYLDNGEIDLFYYKLPYDFDHSLLIDYWDDTNTQKHEANNMNDL